MSGCLFDPKCRELADHFIESDDGYTEEDRDDLARAIQHAVELWFEADE